MEADYDSVVWYASFEKGNVGGGFDRGIQEQFVDSTSQITLVLYLQCKKNESARCFVSAASVSKTVIEVFHDK